MTNDAFIRLVEDILVDAALPSDNPEWWRALMMSMIFQEADAPSDENTYPGFGDVPDPGEFDGEVHYESLPEYDYRLKNKHWGGRGLAFTWAEIETDQTQGLAERIGTYFDRIMNRPARELIKVLEGAGNAYDNEALFQAGAAHRRRNAISIAGTADPTLAQLEDAVSDADSTMLKIKTDQDEWSNYSPDTILCHSELKTRFLKLANSTAGVTANNAGVVNVEGSYIRRVVWSSQLADANIWYFFNTTARTRALIWQSRMLRSVRGAVWQMLMDMSRCRAMITNNQDNRQIRCAVERHGIAGIADPTKVVRVTHAA